MKVKVFSKVILAGEHSVLRGKNAIAVPLKNKSLKINFGQDDVFSVQYNNKPNLEATSSIKKIFVKAYKILGLRQKLTGNIKVNSTIELGEGLGASAAMCSAVGKLLLKLGLVKETELLDFCTSLESIFHGESSGLDIACCLTEKPILYNRYERVLEVIKPKINPGLYVVNSGIKTHTLMCVERVNKFFVTNKKSKLVDEKMQKATEFVYKSLNLGSENHLEEGINLALECFSDWDLTKPLNPTMDRAISDGAISVKPTGAGLGGCVLALFKRPVKKPYTKIDLEVL